MVPTTRLRFLLTSCIASGLDVAWASHIDHGTFAGRICPCTVERKFRSRRAYADRAGERATLFVLDSSEKAPCCFRGYNLSNEAVLTLPIFQLRAMEAVVVRL